MLRCLPDQRGRLARESRGRPLTNEEAMPYADPEKQREFQRLRIARVRDHAIESFGGQCCKCGSKEDLQFDHIDPSKKVTHRFWSWSEKRRLEELRKCQLLCGECHRVKTSEENRKEFQHGTRSMYLERWCRCELCRHAQAVYTAMWRKRVGGRAAPRTIAA